MIFSRLQSLAPVVLCLSLMACNSAAPTEAPPPIVASSFVTTDSSLNVVDTLFGETTIERTLPDMSRKLASQAQVACKPMQPL